MSEVNQGLRTVGGVRIEEVRGSGVVGEEEDGVCNRGRRGRCRVRRKGKLKRGDLGRTVEPTHRTEERRDFGGRRFLGRRRAEEG